MNSRLGYHGAPEKFHGADDLSWVKPGSDELSQQYAAFLKSGAKDSGSAGSVFADNDSDSGEKKYPLGAFKQVLIGIAIVVVAVGIIGLRGALFGDDSDSSSSNSADSQEDPTFASPEDYSDSDDSPSQSFSGEDPNRESTPTTTGDGEYTEFLETVDDGELLSQDQIPAPLSDYVATCVKTEFYTYFQFKPTDFNRYPGVNCPPDGGLTDISAITFSDAAGALDEVTNGGSTLPEIDLDIQSNRGAEFKAADLGERILAFEILPDDEGVVVYNLESSDPDEAGEFLVDLGIAD